MNIKILSDSTCDLPKDILETYNIDLMPLLVIKGDGEYQDGVTIVPSDIFSHVAAGGSLCTTAARSAISYQELFAAYAGQYDGVVHISLGSGFSSSYQNACVAASEFDNVKVIDSANLSVGQGLVVLKACQLAQQAESLDQLVQAVLDYTQKVETSFVLDRLDYMVKGGRCSTAAALGANLLNLKPCIELKIGKMSVGKKYRGQYDKCLSNYVKERITNRDDIDRDTLFLVYTTVDGNCLTAVRNVIAGAEPFDQVVEAVAGCTISCHCGPGTLGVIFARK